MTTRNILLTVAGTLLLASLASTPTGAYNNLAHTTFVTFNGAVALPGKTLAPGQYAFEYLLPPGGNNVVVVRDAHGARLRWSGMTTPFARPAGAREGSVALSEPRAGEPQRILSWFPPTSNVGHAFIY
jgi:hypothetical protein